METSYQWMEFYLADRRVEAQMETAQAKDRAVARRYFKTCGRLPQIDPLVCLHRLYVKQPYRGRGLGSRMMRELVDWFDRHEVNVVLKVRPINGRSGAKQVKALQIFYARYGFVTVPTTSNPVYMVREFPKWNISAPLVRRLPFCGLDRPRPRKESLS